ncbi:kinase-like protein [Teratosphaeria destructans]|uniref:Kinase-like protein n=1 Tax=Teratosphaeria destructans TaxID=418781 RepID=A0A9W7SJ70_9PEZI|nr:kinase-like protein [Teratosphaeria destructans]
MESNSSETIAGGSTALIKLQANGALVEKVPCPNSSAYVHDLSIRDLQREYNAYQTLPRHPRLLDLHPTSRAERLILPYLRHGCLHDYLRQHDVPETHQVRFAADAAEGLHVLHAADIVHGDVNSWNFLVDDHLHLRVIDFAGSTIRGTTGSAFEGAHYCLPRSFDDPSTIRTDLFALGSLICEISTCRLPYEDCSDLEVEQKFRARQFPCTRSLRLGEVIRACWEGTYDSAQLVWDSVQGYLMRSHDGDKDSL